MHMRALVPTIGIILFKYTIFKLAWSALEWSLYFISWLEGLGIERGFYPIEKHTNRHRAPGQIYATQLAARE